MKPDLSSCWAKFRRAEAHVDALKREIIAWTDSNPYRLDKQNNADLSRHGYVIHVLKQPDLERWSLILSDAIHNLRCALDHFAYALAIFESKSNPPPDADILAFPICDHPKLFKGAKRKIRVLGPCVRAEIEGVQPYNRRHPRLPPLLGLLRDFDDSDKHKLLHVAIAAAWNVNFKDVDHSVLLPGESVELIFDPGAEIVDGAEIAAIVYPRPSPDMNHKLFVDIVISIEHRPSPLGRTRSELADVLIELMSEVKTVIDQIALKA